ncbi:protein kinase [Stigmatella sp. ncwal1]|uniref:Protein kinase n=1 Tax=Stigmatella ashevillensis TaxID=2995309 RepID=A0ABT5D0Q7_9BACT|nr:protein kinase [Stigmatella ashevillena]MDC0707254.1 protein kinase [Stigmatella ashevillena]
MNLLQRAFPRLFPKRAPVADIRIHEWKVLRPLGESRNGSLYLVERAGRHSVLKWLVPTDPVREVLAEQELACLSSLSDPAFVKLESHGRWPDDERGTPFFVLEHIPGLSLAQWCRKPGPTAHDIVLVFHKLLEAVGELNDRGMVYPGMTCGDVMIRDGTHSAVVVDLGGVVSYGRQLTKQELSQDVQAAGAMLYEVLTHKRPGSHALPPHVINPRVPRALSELTMRLL